MKTCWRKLVLGVTAWLVLALACNLPARPLATPDLSVEELRQTLAAQPGNPVQTSTPGNPGTSQPAIPTLSSLLSSLATATPGLAQPGAPADTPPAGQAVFVYYAQAGDVLDALARRFEVSPTEIISDHSIPQTGLITPGQALTIPNRVGVTPYPSAVLPDSAVVYSPAAKDFDLNAYVQAAGGYLSTYVELFQNEQITGVEALHRVSVESSIDPRLLLALLEFRAGWVLGQPVSQDAIKYPLGFHISGQSGLYRELVMTATHLNIGYYGWRQGDFIQVKFRDGSLARLSPPLNAGSVAVQNILAKFYDQTSWLAALYGPSGFLTTYEKMFGDAWVESAALGPLFPVGLTQPVMELPFLTGLRWSLTGGPHPSWKTGSPRGAIDFAPVTGEAKCAVSRAWVTASAEGLVARSDRNVVAIDLDGDGYEQTGWVIIYMHVADQERVAVGTWVKTDDYVGHPSCEGGVSTGTHVHIARKYNGEWVSTQGGLPFVLSGWIVFAGERNYQGEMRKGNLLAVASPVGPQTSIITR